MKNPKINNGGCIHPVEIPKNCENGLRSDLKDLLRFKNYCPFPINMRYIATSVTFSRKMHYILK